ncbi:MAG: hypothetical protein M3O80_05870 [Chloroflexota bacterium]|nr:hypothetical protein [Chloroflexota bacterium]
MDDPRLVALGLVPPAPGQETAEESPAAPAAQPATPDWQPLEQSQYAPQAKPFSEAANTIPQYPDPFTTPLPPVSAPPAAPAQPAVPSIFNSPNSPFAFAAPEAAPAAPQAAPSPFTSPNSPFGVAAASTSFTAAAPAAPTTKIDKKALKRAEEDAKKNAKLAEENAVHMAKIAAEDAKKNVKLAAAQAKLDAAQAKIDEREAKIAARDAQKAAKRDKRGDQVAAPAPVFVPPAPKPFVPPVFAAPVEPLRPPAYLDLMNAIAKHPNVIRKDVRFGVFGRARLELAPIGIAVVGLRTGTAYTWSEVKDIQAGRGRLVIKTEADREKVTKTKEGTTTTPYVEKLTRPLVVSIDGAAEPGLAPYVAKIMQDMRAQTFNYHATSWLEYENALGRVRDDFAEHDDPFVPAVAGALFAFIFFAGLFILPEIVNLASDIRPPAGSGAFVIQPRYTWLDLRSFVMAVGLSALLTRLVLRLGLGASALAWARGSVRGWHTTGPRALRIATRELARILLSTTVATAALFLGFAAFAPTVASTLVIDSAGLREVVPVPIIGIDKKWSEVTDVQRSEGPGRLEGIGVTVLFSGGRWITTVDHDLSGGTDGQLLKAATSLWQNATR